LLKPLNAGSVNDIKTFWENVIEPLLPDYAKSNYQVSRKMLKGRDQQ
jgi:hypothetical protein